MAEVLKDVSVKDEIVNGTMGINVKSTEGMIVAYTSIVIMALIPIVIGSFRSTRVFDVDGTAKKTEKLSAKDALAFPFIASGFLFTLYMVFQTYLKDKLNLLLSCYFLVLGVFSVTTLFGQFLAHLCPTCIPVSKFSIALRHELSTRKNERNFTFNLFDVISFLICSGLGYWYFMQKHWIANNIFGMAFAIYGVELLQLSSFFTGFILLTGLFFYDIFWVFGTDVMVSVAKSFEAPIKLLFPQNIFVDGISGTNFAMLGLGDIVIPGIFIALLLRFDYSLGRNRKTYFYWTFMAYFGGLLTTIGVMHYFKHAQPALLYLVPACVLTPMLVATAKGDIKTLFSYDESEKNDEKVAPVSETENLQPQAATTTESVDGETKKQN